jgi:ferredoxin
MTAFWRIQVDHLLCNGTGLCAGIAPDHFALGEDHRSRPTEAVVEPDDEVLDAVRCCPNEAIKLTDTNTSQPIIPPA